MDIKIPSNVQKGSSVEQAADAIETSEAAADASAIGDVGHADSSTVERIAAQVVSGEIGRSEAIAQLVGEILDSKMLKTAPSELREELAEVLEAMLETDPYLKSLAAAIGGSIDTE